MSDKEVEKTITRDKEEGTVTFTYTEKTASGEKETSYTYDEKKKDKKE
jgi:hypothetical protein